jgi:hypothetical protein
MFSVKISASTVTHVVPANASSLVDMLQQNWNGENKTVMVLKEVLRLYHNR